MGKVRAHAPGVRRSVLAYAQEAAPEFPSEKAVCLHVAVEFGVSRSVLRRWLRQDGIYLECRPEVALSARRKAWIEDVEWIAASGASLEEAAARVGVGVRWLRTCLAAEGRFDLLAKLRPGYRRWGGTPLVPNDEVREHIAELRERGWRVRQIAVTAGVARSVIQEHQRGGRRQILQRIADVILAIEGDPPTAGVIEWGKGGRVMERQEALTYLREQALKRKDVA